MDNNLVFLLKLAVFIYLVSTLLCKPLFILFGEISVEMSKVLSPDNRPDAEAEDMLESVKKKEAKIYFIPVANTLFAILLLLKCIVRLVLLGLIKIINKKL